ncbi:hypothetical protein V6Z12_A01G005600 [Gossypium hirsutum]
MFKNGVQVLQPRRLPDFLRSYVELGYHYLISHLLKLCLFPVMAAVTIQASRLSLDDIHQMWLQLEYNLVSVVVFSAIFVFGSTVYEAADFDESTMEFLRKIMERSGLEDETGAPPSLHCFPPRPSMCCSNRVGSVEEAELVMFGALDTPFANINVEPRDVGILVVNCSVFNPTPSLTAMIINKYKIRANIKSFNLSGMGCSAGVIAIGFAKDMLRVHRNNYTVVFSTENMTQNWYSGTEKSMSISNCLFRLGGSAVLLSNKSADRWRKEDNVGKFGVSLSKDLMAIAGNALKTNITTLGPLVLPISEKILFFVTLVAKKLFNAKTKPYVPDFKLAFEHFCIHAGGRGVIDELEKNMQLFQLHVEASRMTLHRFGNTSSWDRIWQIAFGSGFKCNSAVWLVLKNVKPSCLM